MKLTERRALYIAVEPVGEPLRRLRLHEIFISVRHPVNGQRRRQGSWL